MPRIKQPRRSGRESRATREAIKAEQVSAGPRAEGSTPRPLQFTRLNWALLGIGVLLIVAGYLALASSSPFVSTVLAPVLLVGAYAVLIPLGLIL